MTRLHRIATAGLALFLAGLMAQPETVDINPPAEGSVSEAEGLEAWARIYDVTSHPRCSNCHVGADGIPMWSGPTYGEARPHGMNIRAGESRIGAEYVPCQACHALREEGANDRPIWRHRSR